jgi:hypothetical protein
VSDPFDTDDVPREASENMDRLLDELGEQCKHWRLRGFTEREIVSALGAGAIKVMCVGGVTRETVHKAVDQTYDARALELGEAN